MSGFKYVESKRVSKTQKRRDAKSAKKAKQLARIEEGEELDEFKDRRIEIEKLDALLKTKSLAIHNINADGDCLYSAIEHQLSIAKDSSECLDTKEIRNRTSEFMLDNADDFMPFFEGYSENDNQKLKECLYREYCRKIKNSKVWGGHLELTAISTITEKPIHIYQAGNRDPIVIEPRKPSKKTPMLLSFHKHLYRLGEHYNSLVGTEETS